MISAEIIADSVNPVGCRLTTWVLTFPRFIHSELMTHRIFSRNAASSRAIPSAKFREAIQNEPADFEMWTANQKGMAGEPLGDADTECTAVWREACNLMITANMNLCSLGAHKQNANRLLEPWMHMKVIVTASQMQNFFGQRCSPNAMPEFQVLAYRMLHKYLQSAPLYTIAGSWHLPFREHVPEGSGTSTALKICTARAARVSYLSFDKEHSAMDDIDLHDKLVSQGHWSPFEHCAQAMASNNWSGNFRGWRQYRKEFAMEDLEDNVDMAKLLAEKPEWIEV